MFRKNETKWRDYPYATWIGMGIAIGATMGAATNEMALWLGIGAAIGLGLGNYYSRGRDTE